MYAKLVWMVALVAAVAVAAPSAAAPPVREPLPSEDFTISGVCTFDVDVEIVVNKEFFTEFSDGRGLVTGALKMRLTNASNASKTLELNIPGPGVFKASADSLVITGSGPWLLFFLPGELGPGSPGLLRYVAGRFTITVGPGGLSFEQTAGTSRDLCPELA